MSDAWVWDMYRQARFCEESASADVQDVNIEDLSKGEPLVHE